jgi:hypothetical protein
MSYRLMMNQMSGTLKTCVHALGICMPSCIGRSARLFFILEARSPQGAVRHVAAPEPTSIER